MCLATWDIMPPQEVLIGAQEEDEEAKRADCGVLL